MINLPDEILLHIYSFLPLCLLLTMRQVSQRLGRLVRDRRLWKWTRIHGMKLYQDKTCFTDPTSLMMDVNSRSTKVAEYFTKRSSTKHDRKDWRFDMFLGSLTAEEFGWIVCRVVAADNCNFFCDVALSFKFSGCKK